MWGEVKTVQKRHYDSERKKMLNWKVLKAMIDGDMLRVLQETVINEIEGGAERLSGRSTSGHLPIQVNCRKYWAQGRPWRVILHCLDGWLPVEQDSKVRRKTTQTVSEVKPRIRSAILNQTLKQEAGEVSTFFHHSDEELSALRG